MPIINYKPTTPSRRNMSVTDYSGLSKVAPEKSLLAPLNKKSGRNSYGRITVRHRGGGNRRKYRIIDFKRQKFDVPGTVKTLEYDPNPVSYTHLTECGASIFRPPGKGRIPAGPGAGCPNPHSALPPELPAGARMPVFPFSLSSLFYLFSRSQPLSGSAFL